MNPKNDGKAPPDPNIRDERLLGKIVEYANPTPEFRCELRQCSVQLQFMAEKGIAEVLRRCRIPTGGKRSKLKGADLIIAWLEEYRKQDEKVMEMKNAPGSKRKPYTSIENKTPKANPSMENSASVETPKPESISANSRNTRNAVLPQTVEGMQTEVAREHRENQPFGSVMEKLSQVNDRTSTLLMECLGLLQLAHKGESPDKFRCGEVLTKIEQRLAEIHGVQLGISLLGCAQSSPTSNTSFLTHSETLQGTPEVTIPPQRRSTYASVTATASGSNNKQRDLRREKISAHKRAIRCDERSFKLKPLNGNGAIRSGLIARGFLDSIGIENRSACVHQRQSRKL